MPWLSLSTGFLRIKALKESPSTDEHGVQKILLQNPGEESVTAGDSRM